MNLSVTLRALTDKIDDIVNSAVESTGSLAARIGETLSYSQASSPEVLLEPAVKTAIQAHIKATLNDNPYCSGTGFASHIESAGSVREYWLLEWWYKKDNGLTQVSLDLDQATQQRLDFRTFEWFKSSPTKGSAYIHGPYVDYICNTSLTLTAAFPVCVQGKTLGVAALDILVSRVEEELLPLCQQQRIILTNRDRRIVFSTNPLLRIGELLNAPENEPVYQTDYFMLYRQ
ncbi:cache domain-containing protein [Mixta intestinalis]|jgi:hypothetical protein|uniref:Cache domain-containing protein n=1 Tax=Mixta intestinalis TaxID=1615494 RepID=A0A6P1PZ93_9GAMM|nr:cache domain-containing protein [Mixta intestinalis]QHM70995.1 hypothetical protein C7M51_01277 [Mixta intestinalis]